MKLKTLSALTLLSGTLAAVPAYAQQTPAPNPLDTVPEKVLRSIEEKVPMGRLGKPEEIANTYAWLASDEASYINGAVIEVSGGVTL